MFASKILIYKEHMLNFHAILDDAIQICNLRFFSVPTNIYKIETLTRQPAAQWYLHCEAHTHLIIPNT